MKKKTDGQQDLIPAEPEQTEFFEVETSRPDPQRGFPELWWKGKRPFNGVHYYPAQHKESHGDAVDGWRNQLYWGDNLQVMGHLLRKFRGKVDLVYIDPPFDSKADYKKTVKIRGNDAIADRTAFEEKQYSDIWTNDEYLQFMHERLVLMRELLVNTGSIIIHCDWHKVHHLRCLADEVFGPEKFRNELVWCYGGGGAPRTKYPAKHDTLLWYTKSDSWSFNKQHRPYSEGTQSRGLTAVKGPNYELSEDGAMLNDWWAEQEVQKILSPTAYENLKYPTQKPEGLLRRIILGHSNPGDLVFDCFCGSGTTLAVAAKTGRRWIGADVNLGAVHTTSRRLLALLEEEPTESVGFDSLIVNQYDVFRNELEARALLMEALAVRPLSGGDLWHGKSGEGNETRRVRVMPVNRITTKADLAPIIQNLDYRELARRRVAAPQKPVERITLLCMGHEPGVGAKLLTEIRNRLNDPGCKVDVEVVDILRGKDHIQFKRDSEAKITLIGRRLRIERFYPMNLLQKLSMERTSVSDWRDLVDSVLIDFNFDGAVLRPTVTDIPGRRQLVAGEYDVPEGAGTIRVKITDVLSDVFESSIEVNHG